jgi:hypothetical protein
MTTLDPKAAFFHVIDAHRWLAASGCAWNLVGAHATNETKKEANRLLQNIDVMVRDCLLAHARSLCKFYRSVGRPGKPNRTDIFLSDFGINPIDTALSARLETYERSIEVHLFHLTDWRDPTYRALNATGKLVVKNRVDWDREATLILDSVLESLQHASKQTGKWQQPFSALFTASTERYRDNSSTWPANLCGWVDVERYLTALGL